MIRSSLRAAARVTTLVTALVALPVLSAFAAPPAGGGGSLLGGGNDHDGTVRVHLISDVAAIAPGDEFHVGLDIRMDDGWHTYWENGGDAGLATSVYWDLPEGFEAGDIQWETPHRYEEEGDVVTFGYGERVLLVVPITAPADLAVGDPVEIQGDVEWLQCKDICIPGGDRVSFRLATAAATEPADDATLTAFAKARERHARPVSALERVALHTFQSLDQFAPESTGEVAVVFEGLEGFSIEGSEFFPRPSDEIWMRDGQFRTDGEHLALVIPIEIDSAVEPGTTVMLPAVVEIVNENGTPWLIEFDVPLEIAAAGHRPQPTNAAVFSPDASSFLASGAGANEKNGGAPAGLLRYLALAFLGGVILNGMPCVLPVISLKVLGFVSQANEDPGKIFRLGLMFAAGVMASFLALAAVVIALQAAGERVGWGFQFQDPIFVGGLAVVVFVLSLSLLGVFEIGGVSVGAGGGGSNRREYLDSFFHGILTTVLATPCTAPMLGTAIAFAFAQPSGIILLIFVTVALGLAAPYVLLSANPAWLKYVPKPGMWMNRFKQTMGFLMLGTLVWLLFVFGAQTGSDGLGWMLAFLLTLGFFCWLHGTFVTMVSSRGRVLTVWAITIVGTVLAYQNFLHDTLFGDQPIAGTSGDQAAEVTAGGIVWEPFTVAYLEESVDAGHTVFIDFTADWCWTCKVNEKTVLADDEVEAVFRENGIRTLKGDWTRKDADITEILERHDRAGVPFYAVYPAGKPDEVIVLPEIINKKLVIESIRQAGASTATNTAGV